MACPYCGREHPEGTKYCPETGKRLGTAREASPKKVTKNLSSPVLFFIGGLLVALIVFMAIILFQKSQGPVLPVVTPNIPATLAAIVNQTASAQAPVVPPATATVTQTMIPPTPTFSIAPATVMPLPTRTPPSGAYRACPNAYPSVLHKGDIAMVSLDPPVENNLRDKPSTESAITGKLEPGEEVNIVGGPECMGLYVWWSVVSRSSGRAGWTAEGDWNDYWLVLVK